MHYRSYGSLIAILLCLFLVPGLVWAGGAAEEDPDDVTIRWGAHPGTHIEPIEEIFIPRYEAETGVTIEFEVLPPDQIWQRFQLEAPDGEWDIGYHSPGWFGYYDQYVADLTPHMERHNFDPGEHYSEAVIESHMRNELLRPGEIIALPRNPQTPILVYREDWFNHPDEQAAFEEEYGRPLEVPETLTEHYETAVFFTRDAGETLAGETLDEPVYGYAASISEPGGMARAFLAIVKSTGLDGFDLDTFESDLDHPILLDAVEYWVQLIEDTFPDDALTWDYIENVSFFGDGRLAMSEMWPEAILDAERGDAEGNIGYSLLPRWEDNLKDLPVGRSFLGGGGVLVFDTPNAGHAYDFLHWLLVENAVEFTQETASFALEESFTNAEIVDQYEFYSEFLPVFQEANEWAYPRQPIAEWGEVLYTPVGQFAADVLFGVETPEQGQQRLVDNMYQVFRDAGYID